MHEQSLGLRADLSPFSPSLPPFLPSSPKGAPWTSHCLEQGPQALTFNTVPTWSHRKAPRAQDFPDSLSHRWALSCPPCAQAKGLPARRPLHVPCRVTVRGSSMLEHGWPQVPPLAGPVHSLNTVSLSGASVKLTGR